MRTLMLALLIGCQSGEEKSDDTTDDTTDSTDTPTDTTTDTTTGPGDTPEDTTPPGPGPEPAGNEAPGPAEIIISPPSPDTTVDLVGTFVFPATDPEADELTYEWAWLRDGVLVPGLTEATVPAGETHRGETWEARVRAHDPWIAGPSVSARTGIINALPTVTASFLAPPASGVDLTVLPVASDPDADPVMVSYTWMVDGTTVNTTAPNTLGGGQLRRGRQIAVRVTADDGQGGTTFTDLTATVPNHLPSPTASLDPVTPTACVPLVCSPGVGTRDDDGEEISATITWTVDGVAWTGADTTLWPGDTVPADAQSDGEVWACSVTVTDGYDTSTASTASGVVTIAPTTESFTVPTPTPVDVLVVVDNSPYSEEELAQLVATFPVLLEAYAENGVDYHVGVTTTDTTGVWAGQLEESASGLRYFDATTPDPAAMFTELASVGNRGSTDERGRRAVYYALTPPLLNGYNAGFYRPDARLDVIVVSDRDDSSGSTPSRAAFIQFLDQLKPDPDAVSFNSLVTDFGCATASDGEDYRVVTMTVGGAYWDICYADWSPFFRDVATHTGPSPRSYSLAFDPVGPVTVTLTPVGGAPSVLVARTDYYVVGHRLVLAVTPPQGAALDVTYSCAL